MEWLELILYASCECGEDSTSFSYIVANNGGETPANDSTVVAWGQILFRVSEVFTLVSCDDVFLVVWMKQHLTIIP